MAVSSLGALSAAAAGEAVASPVRRVLVISLPEVSDQENDIMDKAFDVRPESRLGCQARVADVDLVVEITEESLKAWLDENPDQRKKEAAAG